MCFNTVCVRRSTCFMTGSWIQSHVASCWQANANEKVGITAYCVQIDDGNSNDNIKQTNCHCLLMNSLLECWWPPPSSGPTLRLLWVVFPFWLWELDIKWKRFLQLRLNIGDCMLMFDYWPAVVAGAVVAGLEVAAVVTADVVTGFTPVEVVAAFSVVDKSGASVAFCGAAVVWVFVLWTACAAVEITGDFAAVVDMEIKLAYERLRVKDNIVERCGCS